MVRFQSLKTALISFAGFAALAAAPAAVAGPCGGVYAVDAPTTLLSVARACSVSVASLREANPGVAPGYVRPGEHLAVPISISHSVVPMAAIKKTDVNSNSPRTVPYTASLGFRARTAQRIRILTAGAAPDKPSWLGPEASEGGHYSSSAQLSFQKMAALRIETAGLQISRGQLMNFSVPAQDSGKALVSSSYRLPDYNRIGVSPPVLVSPSAHSITLTGIIDNSYDGCFTLQTADGKLWRLAAAPYTDDMIGQTITVWGSAANNNVCGAVSSISVSHAIYAEPWIEE